MHDEILEAGYRVVGVSPQGEGSHQRFADAFSLPFTLLVDQRKTLIRAVGVDGPMGFGVRRATFLIAADGSVEKRHVSDFMVDSHASFIRKNIKG